MAIPNKIPYDTLFDLWRNWLMQTEWMPLDKWLKNQLRKNTNPKSEFASSQSNNRELSLCMLSAMRYFQVACALEDSFQKNEIPDWKTWDKNWVRVSAKKIPVASFWFWIALREKNENAAPKALRDVSARKTWFEKVEHYFSVTEQSEEILLWSGLRPKWLPLLEERRKKSQWTEEQLTEFIAQQSSAPPLWLRVQKNLPMEDVVKKTSTRFSSCRVR